LGSISTTSFRAPTLTYSFLGCLWTTMRLELSDIDNEHLSSGDDEDNADTSGPFKVHYSKKQQFTEMAIMKAEPPCMKSVNLTLSWLITLLKSLNRTGVPGVITQSCGRSSAIARMDPIIWIGPN